MIKIGALSLELPAGYQSRANSITQHIGQSLAAQETGASFRANQMGPIDVNISRGLSDRVIGQQIADAICSRIITSKRGEHG